MQPISKKYFWSIFFLILAVGLFVRTYHFGPWLHFELDQARDARGIFGICHYLDRRQEAPSSDWLQGITICST